MNKLVLGTKRVVLPSSPFGVNFVGLDIFYDNCGQTKSSKRIFCGHRMLTTLINKNCASISGFLTRAFSCENVSTATFNKRSERIIFSSNQSIQRFCLIVRIAGANQCPTSQSQMTERGLFLLDLLQPYASFSRAS